MEGQGKRLLLAVALALGVMLIWTKFINPPKEDDKPKATATATPGSGPLVVPGSTVGVSTLPASGAEPSTQTELPRGAEQKITLSFPNRFEATFSSWTGGLSSWKLADPRFERDQTKGELLPDPASHPMTGAFQVNFASSGYVVPKNAEWTGTKVSDTEVVYATKTPNLEIEKRFTLLPDTYQVRMIVTAKVIVPAGQLVDQRLAISVFAFQDPAKIEEGASQQLPRSWQSSSLVGHSGDDIRHTPVDSLVEAPRQEINITWTGFEHPYLLAAYAPKPNAMQSIEKRTFFVSAEPKGLMRTDILFPKLTMKAGDPPLTQEVVAYLGPKIYNALEAADEAAGFATGFKETIDMGWFAFIGKPLLWLMLKFYAFFGNWGLAIILLTFIVKAATLYWTTKSMRSMKSMAALAPQMKILQAKYKGDNQRLQAESMALYKTHKVSPIAGCLPIFLQMPIWLALYRMLSSAGELYMQPFIPGWIDDLTSTDPFYILPFILVGTMFIQARLTPVTGDSRQQKFIQYGMPLMFGVMSFFFPAGLTLYIFTNTVLSALHSIYMNKYDKKSIAMIAKIKESVDAANAKEAAGQKGAAKNGAQVKASTPATPAKKSVIDVESVETDAEDESEAPAATAGAANPARPRNKRKKRRR
ncbi:MAG: membrane protein insertase YidC [Deltaproteobacteria bacterium]|nr:membrane protein insertase YidC [Deltaproteobacteria bacterium]